MYLEELDLDLDVTEIDLEHGTATISLWEDCEFHVWFLYEPENNEYRYISCEYYGLLANDPKWTKGDADEILDKVLTDYLESNDLLLWQTKESFSIVNHCSNMG